MENTEKWALITGATSGIGYELAKLFAKDGYDLIIVARTQQDLDTTAEKITHDYGVRVTSLQKDLFTRNGAFEVYDFVKSLELKIDALVNDAGQGQYGEFINTDINRELDIIQLNIASMVVLTKLFLKDMIAAGSGKILNLSSIASKTPGPWQSVYHGTKAFVQSFTEAVREEVKDKGVTITALLPGVTATDFFRKADMLDSKMLVERDLADAAEVAKDGYDALMKGDDMIVSGLKNKMQVAMSSILSDEALAKQGYKQQAPVEHEK
jgi:short-subunit dehydrogenase